MTLDSFARLVVHRWKSFADELGIRSGDFNETCDACGRLLEIEQVAQWIAATFPVVVVDEAQELRVERLRIIRALDAHLDLYIAADEFQCLDDEIDTTHFTEWFMAGHVTRLDRVRRTDQEGLLRAANAVRHAAAPVNGVGFRIAYEFPNQMPFAIGRALHQARADVGTIALIVAPGSRQWADEVIGRLGDGLESDRQVIPPLRVYWERRPDDEIEEVMRSFNVGTDIHCEELIRTFDGLPGRPHWVDLCIKAVDQQRRVRDQQRWTRDQIEELVGRKAALHRAYGYQGERRITALTINAAKNRQFRHVIVLWGPGVHGDANQRRRLLYNAITRAELSCTVFVRTENLLMAPPFQEGDA